MILIGICGGSGSGKSTLADRLAGRMDAGVLRHDMYYHVPLPPHVAGNWDHPDSYNTGLFLTHLDMLAAGHSVMQPDYRFRNDGPTLGHVEVAPRPVMIVEGILVLAVPEIRNRLGFRIFVDAPEVVRLERRVRRDVAERGRTETKVRLQWMQTVSKMHNIHVEPSRGHASIVVDGESDFGEVVECVAASHKT